MVFIHTIVFIEEDFIRNCRNINPGILRFFAFFNTIHYSNKNLHQILTNLLEPSINLRIKLLVGNLTMFSFFTKNYDEDYSFIKELKMNQKDRSVYRENRTENTKSCKMIKNNKNAEIINTETYERLKQEGRQLSI